MRESQPDSRRGRIAFIPLALGVAVLTPCAFAAPGTGPDETDPVEFYLADELSYDDNLFRVPEGLAASDPAAIGVPSTDDLLNRASAGVHGRWDLSRQVFGLDLRLDDVRFQDNSDLNYVGGNAGLQWKWQTGKRWSGLITGQYDRALANYSNYRFFAKDLVDVGAYGAEVRFHFGSRWSLLAAGTDTRTNHSADERADEEFHGRTARGGLEYRTPSDNLFAAEYRYTDGEFPNADPLVDGFGSRYFEHVPTVRVSYIFTPQTSLEARYGYLERTYQDPAAGDFAGGVWNAKFTWRPREKLWFEMKGWHELRAYEDSESQYFVAQGWSFGPTWAPREKLQFTLLASMEDQDYVSAGTLAPSLQPFRKAQVQFAQLGVDYSPRKAWSIRLAYRHLRYDSNLPLEDYDDNVVSAQVRFSM
ncbi:MAG TPA: outer membrane beta-barrel protein [Steroidobacteraceae bacterium]|nr:outer membrane beta-barrel protein [Steroidobacteraceae bacterium]